MAIDYTNQRESVKEHYADLLIMQYHSKYKARETVKLGADIYMGDSLIFEIQDILDIDKAEGVQLDLIGKILDCPRAIPDEPKDVRFFSFHKDDALGFSTIGKLSQGFFKDITYNYGSTYYLSDIDYRTLLKFKAIANRVRASWKEIDDIFYTIWGNAITVTNNKNLTITYNVSSAVLTDGLKAAIKLGYLEPPLGIGYDINYIED